MATTGFWHSARVSSYCICVNVLYATTLYLNFLLFYLCSYCDLSHSSVSSSFTPNVFTPVASYPFGAPTPSQTVSKSLRVMTSLSSQNSNFSPLSIESSSPFPSPRLCDSRLVMDSPASELAATFHDACSTNDEYRGRVGSRGECASSMSSFDSHESYDDSFKRHKRLCVTSVLNGRRDDMERGRLFAPIPISLPCLDSASDEGAIKQPIQSNSLQMELEHHDSQQQGGIRSVGVEREGLQNVNKCENIDSRNFSRKIMNDGYQVHIYAVFSLVILCPE